MKGITRKDRRLYSVRTNSSRCQYIVNGWLIDSDWSKRNDTIFCYDWEHRYIFKFIFLFLSACESDARQVRGKRMRIILINSALQKKESFL